MKSSGRKKISRAAAALLFALMFLPLFAAGSGPCRFNGGPAVYAAGGAGFLAGGGSLGDPYQISDAADLKLFARAVGDPAAYDPAVYNGAGVYYALTGDIDLGPALGEGGELYGDGNGWVPIGSAAATFSGVFNGRGFTISNLWMDGPGADYAGFFGYANCAAIENLNIVIGPKGITGNLYAGGIAGHLNSAGPDAYAPDPEYPDKKSSFIQNCSVLCADGGSAKCAVTALNNTVNYGAAGGLCGITEYAAISESYFVGRLNGAANVSAGGIAGAADGTSVENCYVRAYINADTDAGGIFGMAENADGIMRCYTDITSPTDVDPFVGHSQSGCGIDSSYYADAPHTKPIGINPARVVIETALDPAERKAKDSFAAFDFDTVWGIYEGLSEPYLTAFGNVVLIMPFKIYGDPGADRPQTQFTGNYNESMPILVTVTGFEEYAGANVSFYPNPPNPIDISYYTDHAYQIFVVPYEIRPAALIIRADDAAQNYGEAPPVFGYTPAGFRLADGPGVISGSPVYTVDGSSGGKLRRGKYTIEISGLSADNYAIRYESGTLTVTGLYPYEIALISIGGAAVFALIGYIVFLLAVKKKTLADIGRSVKGVFIKTKIVETVREVPLPGMPLPMEEFTPREREVAELLLQGKSRSEIASALFVSEYTVKTHTQHVFEKTEVASQKAFIAKYLLGNPGGGEKESEL